MNDDNVKGLGEIMLNLGKMVEATAQNVHTLSGQVVMIEMSSKDNTQRINAMEQRMTAFEDNERLTKTQQRCIRSAVNNRSRILLGIELDDNGRPVGSSIKKDKLYRGAFSRACYCDAKRSGIMAATYDETPKKDYDKCMEFIEAWIPRGGVYSYIEYLDRRRSA